MQLSVELIHQIEQETKGLSYPEYVQKLKEIGVANYEVRVENHNRKFTSVNGEEVLLTGDLPVVSCADYFNTDALKTAIIANQKGLTDYPQFLNEIAAAGVHNYLADLGAMKILYLGAKASDLYTELIPNKV